MNSNQQTIIDDLSDTVHRSVGQFEWNGLYDFRFACYPFACDCYIAKARVSGPEKALQEEFIAQVESGTVNEWYKSGRGQLVLPLPSLQLNDVLNDVTTIKTITGYDHYHLVYKNATELGDRPVYPGLHK